MQEVDDSQVAQGSLQGLQVSSSRYVAEGHAKRHEKLTKI
jgi:hypothetical protein